MIVTAGELLVEFISNEKDCGLSKVTDFLGPFPSGAPAIFIDQAARIGAKTLILGGVGKDAFGQMLLKRLADDGVDVGYVNQHADKVTGVAFVSYYSDGNRIFVFHIEDTAADDFSNDLNVTTPFIFHISGSSLTNQNNRKVALEICDLVTKNGGKISIDPNIRPELMKNQQIMECLKNLIGRCQIFLPSEADLDYLYPEHSHAQTLERLLAQNIEIVALKKGAQGVRVQNANTAFDIAGLQVAEIDPTGAGDCFCGAFLGLIDQGYELELAGHYANAAAAIHVTKIGPMEHNPTLDEIKMFLNS